MQTVVGMPYSILERMERAVLKVRERLLRSTAALNKAGIPYAVVGGHAVASWVATMDEGAVRNTRNIDLLVRREDLSAIQETLETQGYLCCEHVITSAFFLGRKHWFTFQDGINDTKDTIQLIFAGERVEDRYAFPAPYLTNVIRTDDYSRINLDDLVLMKLTSYRTIDQVHLRDMLDVGLIGDTWLNRLPPILAERLKAILDNPETNH